MGWVWMSDLVGVDVVSFLVSSYNSLQEKRNIAIIHTIIIDDLLCQENFSRVLFLFLTHQRIFSVPL